ncbi:leucyl aminopeptidase [Neisseriaceae bacterium JH1-16]|nr:leucyl aminopeptidase [Neisseriaceae bacterium JH1-16]
MLNKLAVDFSVTSGRPDKQRTDFVVVGVYESGKLSVAACALNREGDGALAEVVKRGGIDGKLGSTLLLPYVPKLPCSRVLLVGLGKEKDFHGAEYRKVCQAAGTALAGLKPTEVVVYLPELYVRDRSLGWKVEQAVIAFSEALYRFEPFKSRRESTGPVRIALGVPGRGELKDGETGLERGRAIAAGLVLTRDLANLPGNICTPSYLADVAQQLAEGTESQADILDETQIAELKMGAFLAVAQGSVQPPRLIVLEHRGAADPDEAPVVLVGKGVTFDAGGISLKPAADMDAMKYDMAGAAALFGVFRAVQALALPLNLVVVVPACENLPSGQALRPGDIVTTMSGQTIEVLNTDAEGRLLLCDALTYAQQRFKPAVLIDVATLTGACVVALGNVASGLFCNKQALVRELIAAGEDSGDRVWPMPLFDEYQKQLDSPFADLANIGGKAAGSITAACFLSRFAGETDWAHLDIAGTASRKEGATGRPVRMLLQYLQQRAERRSGPARATAPAEDSAALLWESAGR